jgi:hypothetical protein
MTYSEMMNTMTSELADKQPAMTRKIVQAVKAGYPRKHVVAMINGATK